MSFSFRWHNMAKTQVQKIEQAQKKVEEIFAKHPALKKLDQDIKAKEARLKTSVIIPLKPSEKENLTQEVKQLKQKYANFLTKHNIPVNFREPVWDCQHCKDRGEILTPQGFSPCSCQQKKHLLALQQVAGIPSKFNNALFENSNLKLYSSTGPKPSPRIRAEKAYEATKRFTVAYSRQAPLEGFFIEGPVGSGKSFLTACIANELLKQRVAVKYITFSDFIYKLKLSFDPESPYSEYLLINEVQNCPLLIIDDLGAEVLSDFNSSILFRIIDYRYREEKPLVVNTTLPPKGLQKGLGVLGEKIVKRLIECCNHFRLEGDVRHSILQQRRKANGLNK